MRMPRALIENVDTLSKGLTSSPNLLLQKS